jgi:hypothetical protein
MFKAGGNFSQNPGSERPIDMEKQQVTATSGALSRSSWRALRNRLSGN